jgi:PP-loop superfamily ATP-utilizing enzyme
MNIEQGMSKEEVRGLSERIATKNAKKHKELCMLKYLRE